MFEIEKNVKSLPEMSENLKFVTEKINQYQQIVKNSILAISLILADMAEKPKEYLENSKFTSIAEYAEEMFGYKKAYTYKLIKINKFVSITDKNGEKLSVDYLLNDYKALELAENGNCMKIEILKDSDGFEFSTSQLLELIPLSMEQIKLNITFLDSSLSCKELRSIVKDIVYPPIETTGTIAEETDSENTEFTEKEEVKELTDKEKIMKMLEICSGMEDTVIKERIINVFQKSLKALEKEK